jgi:hypothetical protein
LNKFAKKKIVHYLLQMTTTVQYTVSFNNEAPITLQGTTFLLPSKEIFILFQNHHRAKFLPHYFANKLRFIEGFYYINDESYFISFDCHTQIYNVSRNASDNLFSIEYLTATPLQIFD